MKKLFPYIILTIISVGCDRGERPHREAKLISYSHSDTCVSSKGRAAEVEIIINGLQITVVHKDAQFNCCADSAIVKLVQEDTVIKIFEEEVTPDPCRCVCTFEVSSVIEVNRPGTYILEIYTNEWLVYRKRIRV